MERLARIPTSALVLIIFFLGLLVYSNSLANNFVWDDEEQVINNPFIRNWKNLPLLSSSSTFSSGGAGLTGWHYKPLTSLLEEATLFLEAAI